MDEAGWPAWTGPGALGRADGPVETMLVQSRTPSPPPSVVTPPPPDPLSTVGAVLAIALALAAGILGYRIIRGGRGL